jgi:hypothetical protein
MTGWRGWSKLTVRTSDRDEFAKLPGTSQADKFHNLLIAKGAAQVPTSLSESEAKAHFPSIKLLSPGDSGENWRTKVAACQKMDFPQLRCLRNAPMKTYKIDKEICEACQFSGNHYPPDLNGKTPSQLVKEGRISEVMKARKEIAEMELEKEKERTDRAPVRVLY